MWLGRFLWKRGDGWLIDGFGPDGVSARVLDVTRSVVRLQTGYLYHYAFAMLIGVARPRHLDDVRGMSAMTWPILSTVTFLPLVGAALIFFFIRGDEDSARRNILNVALGVTIAHLRPVAADLDRNFDPANPGFQFVEEADWLGGFMTLPDGRRRHLDAVRHPDHLPDAVLHPRQLAVGAEPAQGIHDRLPGARDADDRRLLRARPVLFYVFFEGGLIPMFLIIGIWGGPRRVYAASSSSSTRCSARC